MQIALGSITRDPRCQSRVEMSDEVVTDYADAMKEGATFPAVTLFHDGATYWLADGFHRVAAAEEAGVESIAADVRQGGVRDAELYALGVNDTHGLRRSRADKWRAVEKALSDAELATWTDNAIAKQCSVSHHFVAKVRASLGTNQETQRTYRDRWGNVTTMDVSNIGTSRSTVVSATETVAIGDDDDETAELRSAVKFLVLKYGVDPVRTAMLREVG
jgi:hypothetical protein